MIKLTHSIVNENMQLLGFRLVGKASDFGEFGSYPVEKNFDVEHLCTANFTNRQIICNKNGITTRNSFKINKLPMLLMSGDTFTNFDNRMALVSRFVYNNQNVGYGVQFANGEVIKYTVDDVIKLTGFFNPTNFVVRNMNGKLYIAGRQGTPIESLPEVSIGSSKNKKNKKSNTIDIANVGPIGSASIKNYDIITLFDWMKEHNAVIVRFPNTTYEATGEFISSMDESFKVIPIGEVGRSNLEYNESKLNASCKFKVPGTVLINNGSAIYNAKNEITFIYRTKNLFNNGKCRLEKVGAIVNNSYVAELTETFAKSMAITEVTDKKILDTINQLYNMNGSTLFEVDIKNLELMSVATANKYLLKVKDIRDLTYDKDHYKVLISLYKNEVNRLKNNGFSIPKTEKTVHPKYANKTPEELDELTQAGIDIYTGAFVKQGEQVRNSSAVKDEMEIAYSIQGLNPSDYTGVKLLKAVQKAADGDKELPEFLVKALVNMTSIKDSDAKLNSVYTQLTTIQRYVDEIKEKLWKHKAASWVLSNKRGVHSYDASDWSEIKNSRARTYKYYQCNVPGCTDLKLAVKGIDIV